MISPDRYDAALREMPESGGGGCHVALLSVANLGALAGLSPEQISRDLRVHIHGKRHVSDREIRDAVSKAFRDFKRGALLTSSESHPHPAFCAERLLRGVLAAGDDADEADLWECSPIRLDWPPDQDAVRLLKLLYLAEDRLFIGARHDAGAVHIRSAADWCKRFEAGAPVPEHVIPNPLTGNSGETKDGKLSFRADSCVACFRFAVLEFDQTPEPLCDPRQPVTAWPREAQCQFWAGALTFKWPIAALIDSGGKSIHAWLVVNAADAADWTTQVEGELFARMLVPLGVDRACKNEARLSRMPGHFRIEKSRWQRVLYLNPNAGNEVKP
jgi:hypothetical protein